MSGYFLYHNKEFTIVTYKQILIKRLATLFLPYVLWNFAALIANVIAGNYRIPLSEELLTTLFIQAPPSLGPINHPLWYVRDLLIFVLINPVLYYIGKSVFKFVLLFVLMILWLMGIGESITYNGFGGLLFFYIGMFLSINNYDIYAKIRQLANKIHLYIVLYILCVSVCVAFREVFPDTIFKLFNLVAIFLFMSLLERYKHVLMKTANWTLSQNSFFIYCAHGIFTGFVSGILMKALSVTQDLLIFIALQFIIIFGAIAIISFTSNLIKRVVPTVYYVLSGGR